MMIVVYRVVNILAGITTRPSIGGCQPIRASGLVHTAVSTEPHASGCLKFSRFLMEGGVEIFLHSYTVSLVTILLVLLVCYQVYITPDLQTPGPARLPGCYDPMVYTKKEVYKL
jgi:hypothetical protein